MLVSSRPLLVDNLSRLCSPITRHIQLPFIGRSTSIRWYQVAALIIKLALWALTMLPKTTVSRWGIVVIAVAQSASTRIAWLIRRSLAVRTLSPSRLLMLCSGFLKCWLSPCAVAVFKVRAVCNVYLSYNALNVSMLTTSFSPARVL